MVGLWRPLLRAFALLFVSGLVFSIAGHGIVLCLDGLRVAVTKSTEILENKTLRGYDSESMTRSMRIDFLLRTVIVRLVIECQTVLTHVEKVALRKAIRACLQRALWQHWRSPGPVRSWPSQQGSLAVI